MPALHRSRAADSRVLVPAFRSLPWLACVLIALAAGVAACAPKAPSLPASAGSVSALEQSDTVVGTGAQAVARATVKVHYKGWLYDKSRPERKGTQFDSSRGGQPFQFVVGAGQVIAGWDQGVQGMKVGGQRRLVIPASLAYGDSGAGGVIPGGASLVFDVELIDVAPPGS